MILSQYHSTHMNCWIDLLDFGKLLRPLKHKQRKYFNADKTRKWSKNKQTENTLQGSYQEQREVERI